MTVDRKVQQQSKLEARRDIQAQLEEARQEAEENLQRGQGYLAIQEAYEAEEQHRLDIIGGLDPETGSKVASLSRYNELIADLTFITDDELYDINVLRTKLRWEETNLAIIEADMRIDYDTYPWDVDYNDYVDV